jgi:hypothetical protein
MSRGGSFQLQRIIMFCVETEVVRTLSIKMWIFGAEGWTVLVIIRSRDVLGRKVLAWGWAICEPPKRPRRCYKWAYRFINKKAARLYLTVTTESTEEENKCKREAKNKVWLFGLLVVWSKLEEFWIQLTCLDEFEIGEMLNREVIVTGCFIRAQDSLFLVTIFRGWSRRARIGICSRQPGTTYLKLQSDISSLWVPSFVLSALWQPFLHYDLHFIWKPDDWSIVCPSARVCAQTQVLTEPNRILGTPWILRIP